MSYLIRFVVLFAGRSCFRFATNLTIGFSMDEVESKIADVIIIFSG